MPRPAFVDGRDKPGHDDESCVCACALANADAFVDRDDADAAPVEAHGADRALGNLDSVVEIERHAEGEQ